MSSKYLRCSCFPPFSSLFFASRNSRSGGTDRRGDVSYGARASSASAACGGAGTARRLGERRGSQAASTGGGCVRASACSCCLGEARARHAAHGPGRELALAGTGRLCALRQAIPGRVVRRGNQATGWLQRLACRGTRPKGNQPTLVGGSPAQ